MEIVLYSVLAYLLGSIPFGLVVGKLFGKDVRKEGSGNIGATNVTRVIGKKAGFLVLVLDALKGFLPVYYLISKGYDPKIISVVSIFAVVGHTFSVFMKFNGGKGVATSLGVLLALSFKSSMIVLMFWLGIFLATGYVSLASILSASVSWVVIHVLSGDIYYTYAAFLIGLIVIFKHKSNIDRLLKGQEYRFIHK